ncbi:phage P2 FII-like protein [Pseudomonas saudiphocaensis]|uniref:Phage P2 FII-like protein n=1 Tax=Pseudomonas saudiphocaensis TaxID=1499686 RepID=A0A078LLW6_9PSED|nr:phage P2 FII-like protein [Pseudomonas saudiphocaensis]
MALPKKLKNMNLFNDGESYVGQCKSVTLPTLGRKLEAWRGGGMDGPVKVDLGHSDDGIQLEWTLGGWDLTALRQFGAVQADGVMLRWDGAVQRDDTGEVSAVEVVVGTKKSTSATPSPAKTPSIRSPPPAATTSSAWTATSRSKSTCSTSYSSSTAKTASPSTARPSACNPGAGQRAGAPSFAIQGEAS